MLPTAIQMNELISIRTKSRLFSWPTPRRLQQKSPGPKNIVSITFTIVMAPLKSCRTMPATVRPSYSGIIRAGAGLPDRRHQSCYIDQCRYLSVGWNAAADPMPDGPYDLFREVHR